MDSNPDTPSDAAAFYAAVFPAELDEIKKRSNICEIDSGLLDLPLPLDTDTVRRPRCERGLTGLALSGGGIRSATFNLGLLQGMAKIQNEQSGRTLLPLFDYLSTVSGGGYIGSWLAGWIRNDGAATVEAELKGKPRELICETNETPEPPQIQHLRSYSNYLTPKLGLFSADTWALIAAYLRNAFINQLVVIPLLGAVLLVPRLMATLVDTSKIVAPISAFILISAAMWCASYNAGRPERRFGKLKLLLLVCLPLVLAAFVLLWLPLKVDLKETSGTIDWIIRIFFGGGWALVFIALNLVGWLIYSPMGKSDGAKKYPSCATIAWCAAAVLAGLAGGFFFADIFVGVGDRYLFGRPWHLVIWGPPVALLLFVMALNIQLGLRGKYESDMSREWWASMTGLVLVFGSGWLLLAGISIYGPLLFELLQDWTMTRYTLIGSWLLSTLGAILAGRSPKSGALQSTSWMDYAAKTLAPIAVIGLLVGIAIGLNAVLLYSLPKESGTATIQSGSLCANDTMGSVQGELDLGRHTVNIEIREGKPQATWCNIIEDYWEKEFKRPHTFHIVVLLLICLFIASIMGWAVDVNQFSMHAVYRNRLVRCYLRAIRKKGESKPNEVTDLDTADDFPLSELARKDQKSKEEEKKKTGPYLLINATLNITNPTLRTGGTRESQAPRQLRWQERKAAAFIMTPLYCGSNLTGYRQTEKYADNIGLGTAMAISGAAFTSNMGYHSSRALAFFLSIFNVRLGWWLGNPGSDQYGRQGPKLGLFYLLVELFGMTDEYRKYLYLSDGGHFDNLGLYELVRRRCRYIVCSDAGEDRRYTFDDLGMAIRKIRADFGVDIEINLDMIKQQEEQRYSRWHHAIGTIRYDMVDKDSPVGMLIYIKASLVGDEPADVLEYKANHPLFPHESTLDQFFSESQFESYRCLGQHISREVFRHAQYALK